MASNGQIANPSKTALLLINNKQNENQVLYQMQIGKETVIQVITSKLLGMMMEDSQKWQNHITGKGGVIPSLNKRLFLLRRLKNRLNPKHLKRVTESIFNSKLRYGLQLIGKVSKSLANKTT